MDRHVAALPHVLEDQSPRRHAFCRTGGRVATCSAGRHVAGDLAAVAVTFRLQSEPSGAAGAARTCRRRRIRAVGDCRHRHGGRRRKSAVSGGLQHGRRAAGN